MRVANVSGIVVQKYGGSSVATPEKIKLVAERIAATRRQGKQVVVVVSAMGTTTNDLLEKARAVSPSPSRRELDMLLTCGERASMALLSMAVSELGYEAISFTGSQCGILTNDRHSGARIIEVRPIRVQDELEKARVVIVAGFQGVSYKREITTLGRGGSDTTAVALAAALGAEYCEICSDVDGVYTADPRLVSAARLLDAISYDEMLELAAHGARVLHAEAVEFARRSDIALYARATDGSGAGTRIDRRGSGVAGAAVGVTGQKKLVRLLAAGTDAVQRLLDSVEEASLSVLSLTLTEAEKTEPGRARAELWFALDDVPDWSRVRDRLAEGLGAALAVEESCGAVSVVGERLGASAAAIASARRAAEERGVALLGTASSPMRLTLFCRQQDVDTLVAALHAVFCEQS